MEQKRRLQIARNTKDQTGLKSEVPQNQTMEVDLEAAALSQSFAGKQSFSSEGEALIDPQVGFKRCLKAITDKEWSRLFSVRQELQALIDIHLPNATNLTDG